MITILCDFRNISVKKLTVFLKTNIMIQILHKQTVFCTIYARIFGENILQIKTSVQGFT
jgi:hypothetical protein